MRKKIIPPYPTLSESHLEVIVSYHSDGNDLQPENLTDGSTSLSCNGTPWIAQNDSLTISIEIDSDVLLKLKRTMTNVLPAGAMAGIALSWQSKGSLKCGVSDPIPLEPSNQEQPIKLELKFKPGEIRDTLSHELIVYLQSPADALERGETHKCNTMGARLGILGDHHTIRADGRGSVFPIFPVAGDKSGALWSLNCNWSDCKNDSFDGDSFRININTNHRDCPGEWTSDEKRPLSPLTKSIIRDAIATLILSVQSEDGSETWNTIKRTESLSDAEFSLGSVAHALWHFYNQNKLNDETPADLMESCGKIKL